VQLKVGKTFERASFARIPDGTLCARRFRQRPPVFAPSFSSIEGSAARVASGVVLIVVDALTALWP